MDGRSGDGRRVGWLWYSAKRGEKIFEKNTHMQTVLYPCELCVDLLGGMQVPSERLL